MLLLLCVQTAVQDPDRVRGSPAEQRAVRPLRGPAVPHRADRDKATQVSTHRLKGQTKNCEDLYMPIYPRVYQIIRNCLTNAFF